MNTQKQAIQNTKPSLNAHIEEKQKKANRKAMKQLRDLKKGKRQLWDNIEA